MAIVVIGATAWVSWEEYRHDPFADEDCFAYGAVLLEQRAIVGGRCGIEERDFRLEMMTDPVVYIRGPESRARATARHSGSHQPVANHANTFVIHFAF